MTNRASTEPRAAYPSTSTRVPRGQKRGFENWIHHCHTSIPIGRWASISARIFSAANKIYDVDRLRTRPLTTSTIFLLAAAARSSFRVVLLPTGPTLRVFPFSSLSFFLSFSKGVDGIIESTCVSKKSEFPLLPIREITNLYLNVLLGEARRKGRNNSFRLSSTPLLPHQISLLRASTRAEMRKARDPRPTRLVPSLPSSFSSSSLPSLPAVFLLPNPAATSPLSRPLEETVYRPRRGEEITGI